MFILFFVKIFYCVEWTTSFNFFWVYAANALGRFINIID